jgi:hypothetical protein
MHLPLITTLDEVLLQAQAGLSRKVLFYGEGVGEISSYVAGWVADKGTDVIVLDGANRFDPYMISSYARKVLIPPDRLLKKIRIARAFTCYQMATLVGERLVCLLRQEKRNPQPQKPWVILLGLITTFLDEDVPEREVRPLLEKSLRKVEELTMEGIPFLLFQPLVPLDSKRAFLTKRLFQFSNLVWKISLGDEGPKIILEKGLRIGRHCESRPAG